MADLVPVLALVLIAAPFAWTGARRFRHASQGQAWFLAERRFLLRRYRHIDDGRRYHPARNPEVARLLDEEAVSVQARLD